MGFRESLGIVEPDKAKRVLAAVTLSPQHPVTAKPCSS
jgi:hypothetical protein